MFSRKEQLIQKTGETGVGRYEFLSQLINEFTTTKSTGRYLFFIVNSTCRLKYLKIVI